MNLIKKKEEEHLRVQKINIKILIKKNDFGIR